jgi:hypothetical protein
MNIGLIDDKDVSRRAFMLQINLKLKQNFPSWTIIDSKPFSQPDEYRQWILENDISVLITDERLDEEAMDNGKYSQMLGSDLVQYLRGYLKDFPIYCITNIDITEKLKGALSYFNLILNKRNFDDDIDNYLNLFTKSGESYFHEFERELGLIGTLSESIAKGNGSPNDVIKLKSLQTRLLIPHISEEVINRMDYLDKLEEKVREIKEMKDELINQLNK